MTMTNVKTVNTGIKYCGKYFEQLPGFVQNIINDTAGKYGYEGCCDTEHFLEPVKYLPEWIISQGKKLPPVIVSNTEEELKQALTEKQLDAFNIWFAITDNDSGPLDGYFKLRAYIQNILIDSNAYPQKLVDALTDEIGDSKDLNDFIETWVHQTWRVTLGSNIQLPEAMNVDQYNNAKTLALRLYDTSWRVFAECNMPYNPAYFWTPDLLIDFWCHASDAGLFIEGIGKEARASGMTIPQFTMFYGMENMLKKLSCQ